MRRSQRICTRRLVMRSWRRSDVNAYAEACNTPEVMRWLGGVQSRSAVRRDVEYFMAREARDGFTFWAVERVSDAELLGFCGLLRLRERDCPFAGNVEIGWRIRKDAWRRGYAFEAATAVLAHAFERLGVGLVVSRAATGNVPSRRLMGKLGLRRRHDLDYSPSGELAKLVVYSLTAEQWRRSRL